MSIEVLDPTFDEEAEIFVAATRLRTLEGTTIGIVSNGKKNTGAFFDAVERELRTSYAVANVVRAVKSNYSAPADDEIMDQAQKWHALISGIGD